jgi:hypothetical protein
MTSSDHQHSGSVEVAARWIVDQAGVLLRPVPEVQSRFGLTAKEACEACAMAARMRGQR